MKITINIKPGMIFARGNDFIKIISVQSETSCIIHYFDINMNYTGAGYMTVKEIEKWIDMHGFHFD